MDSSSDVIDCGICGEEYNEEERCPRGLPCTHCVCSDCTQQLINKNDKQCPFCRQSFEASSVQHLRRNTTVLELVKYVKKLQSQTEISTETTSISRSKMVQDMKRGTYEMCNVDLESLKRDKESIEGIIKDNNELKQKYKSKHTKIKQIIDSLNSLAASYELKQKFLDAQNEKFRPRLEEIKKQEEELEKVKSQLDAATKFAQVDDVIDEAEAFHKSAQTRHKILETNIAEYERNQPCMRENANAPSDQLDSILEVLTSFQQKENGINQIMMDDALYRLRCQLEKEFKENPDGFPTHLFSSTKVHAVQTFDGKTRYAMVTITEKKVCLHSLREQELTPDACKIEYNLVMEKSDTTPRLVFLEFSDDNEQNLGRLYIRLFPNNRRAMQFAYLCSGEKGPSFLNTNIHKLNWKGKSYENVMLGDYENKNGQGGKALLPGVWEEEWEQRQMVEGTLGGLYKQEKTTAAQFFIITKTSNFSYSKCCFGMVEEGLHILQNAINQYPDITKVFISDSGIVLNI